MVKIVHARIDENGQIMGGKPGDQTGKEVCKQDFYEDAWTYVFRPKSKALADKIAKNAEAIAKNDNYGYSQNERYTGWEQAKKHNWDFSKVVIPCSLDCSQLVSSVLNASGVPVTQYLFTWNMKENLQKFKELEVIPYQKGMVLKKGDILLKNGHTVIVVESDEAPAVWVGECYGVQYAPVYAQVYPTGERCSWPTLATGNLFEVIGENGDYYHIRIATTHYGYIRKAYVLRKTEKMIGRVTPKKGAVNVRANAGKDFEYLGTLEVGTQVKICDKKVGADGKPWYYIIYKKRWGFCSAEYIELE